MRILTAAQMRAADKAAAEDYGIPSIVLMENAALGVIKVLEEEFGDLSGKKIAVFCGGGNNGGDGFAVARHLFNRQCAVRVFLLCNPDSIKGDAAINYNILKKLQVEIQNINSEAQLNIIKLAMVNCDAIIDALLGTGLNGMVSPLYKSVIDVINNCNNKVVAVDIPSGLDSDNGSIHGCAVKADITVTFAYPKQGRVLPSAQE